ncbi:prepilin-type N-terminal cleavage/methylation domain-containing protein [Nitrospirillum pindoramense]|uniref:Prepilin-type N-terminal cleavage/methylation domain-containing protein n=2 Tax=Nitrospirillum amazonense TaxID=28077 RepID=A0A560GZT9_9PROT|nr:prepilin-type N-terminal cleavage/methylation domain-containing protein [Nitrospirillum amazonense]
MKRMRGFTLLEMLVALTIFSLVTAMLAHNAWSGVWAARQAWSETVALRLAQSVATAGGALPVGADGTMAKADPAITGLPFLLKDNRALGEGGATYRVEVATPSGQTLAVSTKRVPGERTP